MMERFLDRLVRSPRYLILVLTVIVLPVALAQSSSNGQSGSSGGSSQQSGSSGGGSGGSSSGSSKSGGSSKSSSSSKKGKVTTFTIKEKDYTFTPDHMTWHVGEKVKLKIINTSKQDEHMFMMGKDPHYTKTKFGKKYPKGWNKPLFTDPKKVTYVMGKDVLHENPKPGGKAQVGGIELAKGKLNDEQPMVVMTFTVPNKPGTWHYACFEEKGQHFTAHNMEGTITITK